MSNLNKFPGHIEGIERKYEANTPLAAPFPIHFRRLYRLALRSSAVSRVVWGVRPGYTFQTVFFPMCQITSKCIRSHRQYHCHLFAIFLPSSSAFLFVVKCSGNYSQGHTTARTALANTHFENNSKTNKANKTAKKRISS